MVVLLYCVDIITHLVCGLSKFLAVFECCFPLYRVYPREGGITYITSRRFGVVFGCKRNGFPMTRLSTLLILLVLAYRAGTQVAPINEVVADTLRQTIDIYLTNRRELFL